MYADGLKMLPRGVLLKLVHLERLNLPLDIQVSTEEIENLKRLEEFGGGVKSVSDFHKFVRRGGHDPCYRIRVSNNVVETELFRREWLKVSNDNELELHDCDLTNEKVLAKGIVHLTIQDCKGVSKWSLDDLLERSDNPTSAQPPMFSSLKRLSIYRCKKMRKLGLSAVVSSLSNLEEINIVMCEEVEEIFEEVEDEGRYSAITLPKLRNSRLVHLPRVRKVGLLAASGVPNLERIDISGCGEIQEIFEDEGRAADSIVTLSKLTNLELINLPRLKRASKATLISNSIKEIWITKCPELKNGLPLHFDGPVPPPSLMRIMVERGWWESLEWENPLLPQLLHPFLRFQH